jgi:hypothetical protein
MTGLGVATPTNSIPAGVNVCEPKRSAGNPLAAKAVDHSTGDDDDFAPVSTPIALIRPTGTSQHRTLFNSGQLASFNSSSSNPELGDFEHTTSDSANNPAHQPTASPPTNATTSTLSSASAVTVAVMEAR